MATITDYASLSAAVASWTHRSDVAANLDYFIQVAENRIYREVFALNQGRGVRQMEAALSGTIASNAIPVPADYLGLKIAQINNGGNAYPLERKNEEFVFNNFPMQQASGMPIVIARSGSNFIFGPYADAAYVITGTYWQKAAALSSTNTSTWMITTIPDCLLAAVLVACYQFTRDASGAQTWEGQYQTALQSFITQDKSESWGGSSLAITAG